MLEREGAADRAAEESERRTGFSLRLWTRPDVQSTQCRKRELDRIGDFDGSHSDAIRTPADYLGFDWPAELCSPVTDVRACNHKRGVLTRDRL